MKEEEEKIVPGINKKDIEDSKTTAPAASHVIDIWEPNKERQNFLRERISKTTPQQLSTAASKSTCCIFRVPLSFIGTSYKPRLVSIGPYHRNEPHLQMIEEHKWLYIGSLLSRTATRLEDYFKTIHPLEMEARECYSETINLSTDEFLEMMVLDGCFILELFRKVNNSKLFSDNDPLATMDWILPSLYRDFLLLENQIPFFVLEKLYEISKMPADQSLSLLAMQFFDRIVERPKEVIESFRHLKGLHLLDLFRLSFIPRDPVTPPFRGVRGTGTRIIQCISKLRRSGIKFTRPVNAESFLVVKFRHGVIEMPSITLNEFMSSFLVNCVAFEQSHKSFSKHVTTYATLLDCLVETAEDIEYLCDSNIIENDFGTEADIARFINNMGKDVVFDINRCYLSELFNKVDKYYQSNLHRQWASFKNLYLDTPWKFFSALAALMLLMLTILQTVFDSYGVVHHKT
ncbi:hypothetical protein CJ030_MR3G026790 [Morella rubra]|uniref:Uncharacterized protein n=1 Tax=Morella rubra TaxID=262757 RepID=A0A6A1W6R9_9ROSI|nr:hypothetical protein CJ030_MR3G026790 [Morella rubra]